MKTVVSKSRLKQRLSEYLRAVGESGHERIITDRGRPVVKIVPYTEDLQDPLESLRGSVIRYDDLTESVGEEDWEVRR